MITELYRGDGSTEPIDFGASQAWQLFDTAQLATGTAPPDLYIVVERRWMAASQELHVRFQRWNGTPQNREQILRGYGYLD